MKKIILKIITFIFIINLMLIINIFNIYANTSKNSTIFTHTLFYTIEETYLSELNDKKEDNFIIDFSKEEYYLLAQLIEAEAKGECYTGKLGVGNVVINRVLNEEYPDSITEVVYQTNQFSPVSNGSINNIPSEDSLLAAEEALKGILAIEAENALFYWNKNVSSNNWIWTREIVGSIENHYFGK